jgi:hypothetical protein
MIESLTNEDKPLIGRSIGKFNKFFAKEYKREILDVFGNEG